MPLVGASQDKSRTLYVGPAVAEESTRARRVPVRPRLMSLGILQLVRTGRELSRPSAVPCDSPLPSRLGLSALSTSPNPPVRGPTGSAAPLRCSTWLALSSFLSSRRDPLSPLLLPPLSPAAGDSALPHSPRDSPSIRVGSYSFPSQLRAGCACGALPDPLGRPRLPLAAGSPPPASLLIDVDPVAVMSCLFSFAISENVI